MLVAIGAALVPPTPAAAVGRYNNAQIATLALRYVGQKGGRACSDARKPGDSGGECRAFVNCIVWMVSHHSQNLGGADYFQPFLSAGGKRITSVRQLVKGDIVQIGQGIHTFIIVRRVSLAGAGGSFVVVDSNHDRHQTVMIYTRGVTLSSPTRAYRMGTVPQPKPNGGAHPGHGAKPPSGPHGDSVGMYFPWDYSWHLTNALAEAPSDYAFVRGSAGIVPVVGNWDGQGGDGVGGYRPSDQSWHLIDSPSAGPSNYAFVRGSADAIPVVGDWDGDGKDSTGMYLPWDYSWHLSNSLGPGPSDYAFVFGTANAIPVVGDWNGDGKDSVGMYFPWNHSWHLRDQLSPGPSDYAFIRGSSGGIPVVGDWNGDGADSTGTYLPWDHSWHLRNALNAGPSDYAFVRGRENAIPVVGNWDGK